MSATKNINAEKIQGNLTGMTSVSAISLSGGSLTITGTGVFNTISATTYQNLPTDIRVTGGTYNQSNGTTTFTNNTGGTFNIAGYTTPFTGGTVTGATTFTNGLTATTISATTYQNLPSGVFAISNSAGTYTYYTTLSAAMSAATSGQTIEMFANYTESGAVTISWKNGVNFNGNGYTYTHNHSAGNSTTISLSSPINITISNWRVIRTGRALGTTGDVVFNAVGSSSTSSVRFNGVYFESTYGNSVTLDSSNWLYSGTLYARAYLNGIISAGNVLDGLYGESTTSGFGLGNDATGTNNCIGKSVSGNGLYAYGNVRNCIGISTSGAGLAHSSNGTGPYYNCIGVSTSGSGGAVGSFYNCSLLSTSGIGANGASGANNFCFSSTNYGAYGFFGFSMENSTIISSSNIAAYNALTLKNCSVTSNWNNAGGHAVAHRAVAGNSSLNCTLAVTNASANCITSAGAAITVKYASNVYIGATVPVNTSVITQGITNTQDNQGNILI